MSSVIPVNVEEIPAELPAPRLLLLSFSLCASARSCASLLLTGLHLRNNKQGREDLLLEQQHHDPTNWSHPHWGEVHALWPGVGVRAPAWWSPCASSIIDSSQPAAPLLEEQLRSWIHRVWAGESEGRRGRYIIQLVCLCVSLLPYLPPSLSDLVTLNLCPWTSGYDDDVVSSLSLLCFFGLPLFRWGYSCKWKTYRCNYFITY